MKKSKFFNSLILSFYIGNGIFWFKIFGIGVSSKNILKYNFTNDDKRGWYFNKWLIKFIK